MKKIVNYLGDKPHILYILSVILLFPALLINIGIMPLRFDGAYRGIVALEMVFNNNYIVPTINDLPYYNKPPLFNWMIAAIFNLTGQYTEYMVRIPVIFSMLLVGLSLYLFLKKRYSQELAYLSGIFFVTGGCMFFGYSSVGLVDFTLALFMILGFIAMFHYHEKKNYYLLFIISYLMAAAGYMVKGLPAVVFQGITLLVLFIGNRDFKRLFSTAHFIGILTFIVPIGLYYFAYFQHNPGTYEEVFINIIGQSSNKSISGHGLVKFYKHFFRFPAYVLYNLLPWSLLVLFCLRRDFLKHLNQDKFLRFTFWVIMFNIPIYWLSPGTDKNMKYLFFLFPLMYFIFLKFYFDFKDQNRKLTTILHHIFGGLAILFTIAALLAPFLPQTKNLDNIWAISLSLFIVLAFITILYYQSSRKSLVYIVLIVIITRIGFNLIAQPVYVAGLKEVKFKSGAVEVGKITKGEPLQTATFINEDVSFYIARERMEPLRLVYPDSLEPGTFNIIDHIQYEHFQSSDVNFETYHQFACNHANKILYLVKFKNKVKNFYRLEYGEWSGGRKVTDSYE